ncbi:hypothetical protein C8R44DRAFT_874609 [Mycena epipterygia]|nr:hypothetical protein C8R44DRAFT_874609 [Mycena epipterygia]
MPSSLGSSLGSTFGQWLVALFLQAVLYGTGILQVYLYFFWYNKDHWGIKTAVILITLTFQIATFFAATYAYLIDGFGNPDDLNVYDWQSMSALAGVYASTFVAQMYFAYTIYLFHRKNKIVPLIIVAFALGCLGAGMAEVIRDTNVLLNHLIMTAVNRGVLTMVSAALNLILYFAVPNTFYFMLWILLGGKFYMNSMLAILNTRQYAMGLHGTAVVDRVSGNRSTTNNIELSVQVTRAVVRHDDTEDGKFAL